MVRLSRSLSARGRKSNSSEGSIFMTQITSKTTNSISSDEHLLGDLFITVQDSFVVDLTNKHTLITNKLNIDYNIKHMDNLGSLIFNGKNTNLNIRDDGNFNFGLDDFSIDWWEYQLPISSNYGKDLPPIQYSIYKDSFYKLQPFQIFNNPNKAINISSNGTDWNIADNKYMGMIEENEWTHWAITRSNSNFYAFKNGIIKNTWESEKAINNSAGCLSLGSSPKGNSFFGYMDKIRTIKGTTLWIDEFKLTKEDLFY